jgi:hypothetical protein
MAALAGANFNLPVGIDGDDPDDLPGSIDFTQDHLPLLLDAPLRYGHAYFSVTSARRESGAFAGATWMGDLRPDGWHSGVMPLPQNTITSYLPAGDGALVEIEQQGFDDPRPITIPAARLAAYVFRARPGDWWGAPVLRDIYEAEEWRRVAVETGMDGLEFGAIGTAVAEYIGEGLENPAGRVSADAAVANYRGGGGIRMPAGYRMSILVPAASGVDPLAWVKHMEQKESAAYMATVSELATTGQGNRALGDTLDGHKDQFIRSLATFACRGASRQLVRRLVDWNEGPDAPAPSIRFDDGRTAGQAPMSSDEPTAPTTESGDPAEPPTQVTAAADTGLRRAPTKIEAASAADFAGIKKRWADDGARLGSTVAKERTQAGVKLAAAAAKLDDPAEVAALPAPTVAADKLKAAYRKAVDQGAADALREAKAQGAPGVEPQLAGAYAAADAHAAATAVLIGTELGAAVTSAALQGADIAAHVNSLSENPVVDRVAAGLVAATGEGRLAAYATVSAAIEGTTAVEAAASPSAALQRVRGFFKRQAARKVEAVRFYGSSIMDKGTCGPCAASDGQQFDTLADALQVYPSGAQHGACQGMGRCRCLVVAVYSNETPAVS